MRNLQKTYRSLSKRWAPRLYVLLAIILSTGMIAAAIAPGGFFGPSAQDRVSSSGLIGTAHAVQQSPVAPRAGSGIAAQTGLSPESNGEGSAQGGATPSQRMTYEVYGSGFHVVDAVFDIAFEDPKHYEMSLSASTRGFLGSVAPWTGTFETRGWYDIKKHAAQPQIHKSETVWDEELEIKKYTYNRDGSFGEYRITDEHSQDEKRTVDSGLTDQTTDLFSAALKMMNAMAGGEKCEGISQGIFDGKRRYRIIFRQKDEVTLQKSRYNIYEGPAVRCSVEIEQVAGNWHKKPRGWMSIQEQSRKNGTLPVVWMARLREGGPAVPVKILVKTAYGSLFMHLVKYESGQIRLAARED